MRRGGWFGQSLHRGDFTVVGDVLATASQMERSTWSALGSGWSGGWYALRVGRRPVCGRRVHDGGRSAATNIAKWNGSSWSAPGSGMNGSGLRWRCRAATCMRGDFTRRAAARLIPSPNGRSSWSALGSGGCLATCGRCNAGQRSVCRGRFHVCRSTQVNGIAKWNGSSWSALAVSGSDCMRGARSRRRAAGNANSIAKWERSSWSALGSGEQHDIQYLSALAVSGSDVYAGAISRTRAAARPTTSPNGTGAVGRPWVPVWAAAFTGPLWRRWRCRSDVYAEANFHERGRQRGQLHRQMEREQLVGPGFWDG